MKLTVEQDNKYDEPEIIIRCSVINAELQKIIDEVNVCSFTVKGYKDGYVRKIDHDRICYIESVDEKTFIYCADSIYECKMKLYELEKVLVNSSFVRISKGCILNIHFIEKVKPLINGKYEVLLLNREKLIINRHYVPVFKKKFGL
ncbi:MAG: LytTR family DNA-binding domain-containing protein [Acutalibacteraceae bacterium]